MERDALRNYWRSVITCFATTELVGALGFAATMTLIWCQGVPLLPPPLPYFLMNAFIAMILAALPCVVFSLGTAAMARRFSCLGVIGAAILFGVAIIVSVFLLLFGRDWGEDTDMLMILLGVVVIAALSGAIAVSSASCQRRQRNVIAQQAVGAVEAHGTP